MKPVVKIPGPIRTEIRNLVHAEAEKVGYLTQSRHKNGQFMEHLINNPAIGGRLIAYTGREHVKTYIKDGILHAYAQKKKSRSLSSIDQVGAIKEAFHAEVSRSDPSFGT